MTERLVRRIIDGNRNGLDADLDEALAEGIAPLSIVNDHLLEGMKTVGELFASGEMQLPFVLGSAETMKQAVAHLEPHMEKADQGGRGTIVLATVKGDVHDIGKNLVDIIFTNNGYEVVNLGIKVGISEMIAAVEEHHADALGMSGLLVKSTLIIRENLEELNKRGLADVPVLLGGAALTRTYVERDLRSIYDGRLFYGKDAFEGLRTMDRLMELDGATSRTTRFGRELSDEERPAPLPRRLGRARGGPARAGPHGGAGQRHPDAAVPWQPGGTGHRIDEITPYLNQTALFRNQWGFRPEDGEDDAAFKERVAATLREQLAIAVADDLLVPQVVWGHFAANADGNDVVLYSDEARSEELTRFRFPRQKVEPWLCIADFFARLSRATPTTPASCWSPWASGSRRAARSSSTPTSTSPTSSSTGSASRWPRRSPSSGTGASARSSASPTRTAPPSPGCSASSTGAGATRGAIRPART